ncbi:MAG: tetratricopeptide repeat protein [Polyangia bacterium]
MISRTARQTFLALAAVCLGACATQPPPVTKLVNDRQIVTRSVNASAYEHASRAFLYEEDERWQDAAAELQRALVFDDESPELQAHLAEIFIRLGRLSDAAAAIRASLKIEVTADGLMAEGHLRQAQGDVAGSVQSLREAVGKVDLADDTDTAEMVYLELAEAQILALDVPGAASTLADLCRREPASLAGHMRLMAVAWALGDVGQTEAQLRQTLAEEPNHIEALTALAWLLAAQGRNDESRRAFREDLDRGEGALEIAAAYARFLVSIGDNQAAEQLADDLVSPLAGSDPEGLSGSIELERSAHRLDRALALVKKAQEAGVSDDAKTRLALTKAALLKEQGQDDEAVATLLAVPKASPLFFEAHVRAAELLRDEGKTSEAARQLESAAASDDAGQKVDAAISLAFIDEKRGDAIMATRRLEALRASQPDQAHLTLSLAMIEERRGAWQHALDLVEPLIKKKPGSVEALNFWGFVAADHGHDLDKARKRLQAAAALEPGSGAVLDSLGWVSFRAGQMDKAALFLEQAGRLEPGDAEILSHLGDLYAKRSEPERAVAAYRKALSRKPEERLRRRLEESLAGIESRRAAGR